MALGGHAAFPQQLPQLADRWKHFLVPVGTLRVVRGLLHLDDLAILGEDPVSEPGQRRPYQIEGGRNLGRRTESTMKVRFWRCSASSGV